MYVYTAVQLTMVGAGKAERQAKNLVIAHPLASIRVSAFAASSLIYFYVCDWLAKMWTFSMLTV